MIPFLNFGISSNVISSLEVPEFIMDFINGNMFYTVIYWTAVSGLTILLIEHHMDLVMDISDRIYVRDFGKMIATGTADEIQNNPKVIKAYLGVEDDA